MAKLRKAVLSALVGSSSRTDWAIWVGICGAIWAIIFLYAHNYQGRPPFAEEARIGIHLAQGHGFLSPMDPGPTAPPSAWSAPVYPWVISVAYRAFGIESPHAVTMLMLVNAFSFGALLAGLYSLGRILFRTNVPGLLAASITALHPLYLFYAGDFWNSMLALAVFIWLTVFAVSRADRDVTGRRSPVTDAVVMGLGMGLLALTNPAYSLSYPVLLAAALPPRLKFRRWLFAGCALLVFAGTLAPWTLRNVAVFGRLFYVRTALELNLWLGSEPLSQGRLDDPRNYALQPYFNTAERELLLTLGEPGYGDLCWERFKRNYFNDPSGYWILAAKKISYLVLGMPLQPTWSPLSSTIRWRGLVLDSMIMNGLFAVLGLAGMVAARHLGLQGRYVPLLPLCLTIPYVLAGVTELYCLPIRALLILYAAFALWRLLVRFRAGSCPQQVAADVSSHPDSLG